MILQIETLMLCIALESVIMRSFVMTYLPIKRRLAYIKEPFKTIQRDSSCNSLQARIKLYPGKP